LRHCERFHVELVFGGQGIPAQSQQTIGATGVSGTDLSIGMYVVSGKA
jgi:hypothetical protein